MALALLALGHLAHCATITWNNPAGGNWSVAANWSPNQVPTNTDTALITTPGTYTVNLDVPGVVTNLTLGAGGGTAGVQTFVVTNLLTVSSLVSVTNGGVLNSSGINAGFSGAMTIANGGVLNLAAGYNNFTFTANPLIATNGGVINAGGSPIYGGYGGTEYYYGSTINGTVSVANGGVFDINGAIGPATVANGGLMTAAGSAGALTVAQGGVLNIINGLSPRSATDQFRDHQSDQRGIGMVNNNYRQRIRLWRAGQSAGRSDQFERQRGHQARYWLRRLYYQSGCHCPECRHEHHFHSGDGQMDGHRYKFIGYNDAQPLSNQSGGHILCGSGRDDSICGRGY